MPGAPFDMSDHIIASPRTVETLRFDAPLTYGEAYATQIAKRDAVQTGAGSNTLMLLEHTPTFTLGRNADESHLLQNRGQLAKMGIEVCEVDRGGDVTYHGPGQLVAYPILNLGHWKKSVSWYLRELEQVLIDLLADYGIEGGRVEGYTGVWADGAKVAAIGVGVHRWVTYHGIALNVDPNMDHWGLIVPCGIPDKPVTSLKRLLGEAPQFNRVMDAYERHFRARFA